MLTYELRDVSLTLGRKRIFSGLDLKLEGRVIGLLGPNGAGKTSLIACWRPCSGRPGGRSCCTAGTSSASRRTPAPGSATSPALPAPGRPDRAAGAPVPRGPAGRGGGQRIDRCLVQTGLSRWPSQAAGAYSGGALRRRLALAQALWSDPQVLLMDEPTAGLDPEEQDRFQTLVRGLAERGAQVLISTHLLAEVSQLADTAVVLHEGRILFAIPVPGLAGQDRGAAAAGRLPAPARDPALQVVGARP